MAPSDLTTPRTRRAAVSTTPTLNRDVHIRLAREHVEQLEQIAEEDCVPLSAIVRRIVVAELRRRSRYPDPVPLARAGAREGNVRAS